MHWRDGYSTFPLGLPNCTCIHICSGRGTDTSTPFFVWKQYSLEWETFSKVRHGNPTLNYICAGKKYNYIFFPLCLMGMKQKQKYIADNHCWDWITVKTPYLLFTALLLQYEQASSGFYDKTMIQNWEWAQTSGNYTYFFSHQGSYMMTYLNISVDYCWKLWSEPWIYTILIQIYIFEISSPAVGLCWQITARIRPDAGQTWARGPGNILWAELILSSNPQQD